MKKCPTRFLPVLERGNHPMVLLRDKVVYSERREDGSVIEAYYDRDSGELAIAKSKRWISKTMPPGADFPSSRYTRP